MHIVVLLFCCAIIVFPISTSLDLKVRLTVTVSDLCTCDMGGRVLHITSFVYKACEEGIVQAVDC